MESRGSRGSQELRKVVIDANLAINVALRGHPYHHQAQRFFADCAQTGRLLLAPPLYESESDSVIRRFVHLSILTKGEGVAAQAVLNALPIIIVYDPKVRARARQVAKEFKQPRVYDALPRQSVHGDYWDNNVLFHDGRVVLVADFDFMGERARIDDLALTLYFTNSTFSADPVSDDRVSRLRKLVDAYDQGLDHSLSSVERAALPLAIARQPLWSIGGWIALLDDEEHARRHAAGVCRDVEWALQIVREVDRWQTAFT